MSYIYSMKTKSLHELPVYIFGEEIVTCPMCGSRTDFIEVDDHKQQHECLNPNCKHEFFVEFEEDQDDYVDPNNMTSYILSEDRRPFAVVIESPEGGATTDLIIEAISEEYSAEQVGGVPFTVKDIDWGESKTIEVEVEVDGEEEIRDITIMKSIAYHD